MSWSCYKLPDGQYPKHSRLHLESIKPLLHSFRLVYLCAACLPALIACHFVAAATAAVADQCTERATGNNERRRRAFDGAMDFAHGRHGQVGLPRRNQSSCGVMRGQCMV